jgi:hypothetical protein
MLPQSVKPAATNANQTEAWHESRASRAKPDEEAYLARASNLLATFRQIAQDEHPNVIAEAALAFLAESLANHPNRDEMVQHVLDQLRTIVDQIAEGEPGGAHQGSA